MFQVCFQYFSLWFSLHSAFSFVPRFSDHVETQLWLGRTLEDPQGILQWSGSQKCFLCNKYKSKTGPLSCIKAEQRLGTSEPKARKSMQWGSDFSTLYVVVEWKAMQVDESLWYYCLQTRKNMCFWRNRLSKRQMHHLWLWCNPQLQFFAQLTKQGAYAYYILLYYITQCSILRDVRDHRE